MGVPATNNRSNWVVASCLMEGDPCDGHTLAATIANTEEVTGLAVTDVYVDKGYRGHDYTGEATVHQWLWWALTTKSNHHVA